MLRMITGFVVICATFLVAVPAALPVTISTVPVGNLGNANDPTTGKGSVSYPYSIGKYEVTVGQYTDFLNAVAATDTYGLYNPSMATDLNIAGIAQNGRSGSYTYIVIGSANHPVTYVSWGDAARFSNWLFNGQPTGVQEPGTTETGSYTLNGATSQAALIGITRNANATWAIPTENEWYKAAYHQPATQGGDVDNYWLNPMRSNSVLYSDQPPGTAPDNTRVDNFIQDDHKSNGYDDGYAVTGSPVFSVSQNYLTNVGAYTLTVGPYGTFDQAGNVREWNEAVISGSFRGLRGGMWNDTAVIMLSANPSFANPLAQNNILGFRLAFIPEPSTAMLAVIAGGFLLRRMRRRVC